MKQLTIALAVTLAMLFAGPAHALVKVKSGQSITLTWQAHPASDIVAYEVHRADSVDGPWSLFATVTDAGHTVETLDLPEGGTVFALIAIDDVGNRGTLRPPSEVVLNDNIVEDWPGEITITVVAE